MEKIVFYSPIENFQIPSKREEDAGYDLFVCLPKDPILRELQIAESLKDNGKAILVNLNLCMALPMGYFGKVEDRSSMGASGFKTAGGVIDCGYRGSVKVCFQYNGEADRDYKMEQLYKKMVDGTAIAQMIVEEYASFDTEVELDYQKFLNIKSERGINGFGSTDK